MKRIKRVMVRSGDDWIQIGVLQGEDGKIKIKLDSVPTAMAGCGFSIWLTINALATTAKALAYWSS